MLISVQQNDDPLLDNIRIWWVLLIKFQGLDYPLEAFKSERHEGVFNVDDFFS